jgi:hypothetical protein
MRESRVLGMTEEQRCTGQNLASAAQKVNSQQTLHSDGNDLGRQARIWFCGEDISNP